MGNTTLVFDTKVLGGLPVTVEAEVVDKVVQDWWITHINDKPVGKSGCSWLYKRIDADPRESNSLVHDMYSVLDDFLYMRED